MPGQGTAVLPAGLRRRRSSCSGSSPRRRPARRGGRCGRWPRGIVSRISYETVRCALKTNVSPLFWGQRCYPPVHATDFVIPMEAALNLYSQPYDARYPVIRRGEQPKPLRADKRPPQSARPGRTRLTYAYAYVRRGPWLGLRHRAAHGRGRGAPGAGALGMIRATAKSNP